jgi:cell division protein FtsZ
LIGIGESDSSNRAVDAVKNALQNKLLDVEYGSGEKALVHFTVGPDVSLGEINEAMNIVYEKLGEKSEIKWGARIDEDMGKTARAMVIMTGVKSPHILGGETALQLAPKEALLPAKPRKGSGSFEDKLYKTIAMKREEPRGDLPRRALSVLEEFEDLT